ncbi:MAG: hypothetical protein PWQ10_633 [Patescibacteria group bacterium]|nr:hypothetical protein [Patescibacteria group bacterium]
MYEFVLPKILNAYGINYLRIYDCQKGYRNEIWPVLTSDNQIINVTFFKREVGIVDRIRRADDVSEYLWQNKMAVRRRIYPQIIRLKSKKQVIYAAVYNYLPGKTIPWEAYTMEHIKNLGAKMSDIHYILANKEFVNLPSVYDEYLSIVSRMIIYFEDKNVKRAISDKLKLKVDVDSLKSYIKLLENMKLLPNQQALHMDFVRGNVLFAEKEISGVIDFEKAALGHCVVDIARTLAFLLVDCKYKTNEKVYKYFLYSGYKKRGRNKDIGNDMIRNKLVNMFLMYDFYKFLRHNHYESLSLNEHFIRTKDILIKYGVIIYR